MPDPCLLPTLLALAGLAVVMLGGFTYVCWSLNRQRLALLVKVALLEAAHIHLAEEMGQETFLPHLREGKTP